MARPNHGTENAEPPASRLPLRLLIAAAVAFPTLAWLLLRADSADVPPAAAPTAPSATASSTTAPTPVPERLAAASDQPPLPNDATWFDVLVVDAKTQAPVPDAAVFWTIDGDWQRARTQAAAEIDAFVRDPERFAQRFGRRTRSDPNGNTKVAAPPGGASVYARAGERYGLAQVGGRRTMPAGGWRVLLERDCTLRVQVLDAHGAPAVGVPVAIRAFAGDGTPLPNGGLRNLPTAAPDAIVEFPHVQTWLRDGGSAARQGRAGHWAVATQVPGHDDPGVRFDRDAPPAEPIVLRLPPTGRLLARLLHERQPVVDGVQFGAYRGSEDDFEIRNRATLVAPGADGWARFPRVALGGTLRVFARVDNTTVETTTEAPGLPGLEVRCDLSTGAMVVLCGRLVGPDGAPLANLEAMTAYHVAGSMGNYRLRTDAQGRFRWFVRDPGGRPAALQSFVVTHTAADGTPRRADVAPRPLEPGVTDLGDVQLLAGPLVVSGQFVFDGDKKLRAPIPHLDFGIEAQSDRRGSNGEEQWDIVHGLAQVLRPDGTFELRGTVRPVRHRLVVRSQRHLPVEPIEFRPGVKDLIVAIESGHPLLAVGKVPDGMPPRLFAGALRRTAGDAGRDRWPAQPMRADEGPVELRWAAVPPGTYELDVLATGHGRPLVTIADVVVPPPPGGDPRLAAIDVLADAAALHLRLAPNGPPAPQQPIAPTLVFVLPQANDRLWDGIAVRGDEIVLPVPREPVELLVLRSGFQPCRIANAAGEATAALQPWPTVELQFADLPPLPAGDRLMVGLRPAAAPQPNARSYRAENGSGPLEPWLQPFGGLAEVQGGRAELPVGEGELVLQVWLHPANGRARPLTGVEPAQIVGGPGMAPIVVRVPTDGLRATGK